MIHILGATVCLILSCYIIYLRMVKSYCKISHLATLLQFHISFTHTDHILKICYSVFTFYFKLKLTVVVSKAGKIVLNLLSLYILVHVYWPLLIKTGTSCEHSYKNVRCWNVMRLVLWAIFIYPYRYFC